VLTGVVAAMEEEVADLRARLHGARTVAVAGAHVTLGWIGAGRVALAVTGDGDRNARRGLSALLAAQLVKRVLVVGVAGGLSPDLDAGALVIASSVINQADGGVAVTATRIADTAEEKRSLLAMALVGAGHLAAGARAAVSDPTAKWAAVVDLESAGFAAVAGATGVPWTVLRAVSDTAADSIPPLLNRSRDEGGAVRRRRVVWGLLTAPGALLPLLALRERVRACAARLAQAVERTVVALQSADDLSPHTAVTEGKEQDRNGT
jgi:nucleoside phosphorylase